MRIARNHKQMGSHMPMLIKCVQMTKGAVCELGCGFNSTPLLHWMTMDRELFTYESNKEYLHYAKKFQTRNHRIRGVSIDYKEVDFDRDWSVVLIDHSAEPLTRGDAAMRFKNATFVVLHDSENPDNYGYDKVWPHFKYRYDFKDAMPWTTVLSNKIDVTKWN